MLYKYIKIEILEYIEKNSLLLYLEYQTTEVDQYIANLKYYRFNDTIGLIRSKIAYTINIMSKHMNDNNEIEIVALELYYDLSNEIYNEIFKYIKYNHNINIIQFLIENDILNIDIYRDIDDDHYSFSVMKIMIKLYCRYGNIKWLKYLNSIGVNLMSAKIMIDLSTFYRMKLIKYIIKHGSKEFNTGLYHACCRYTHHNSKKHKKLIRYFIQEGATQCSHCNETMEDHPL